MSYNFLICGHLDITLEQFNKYYIPDIEAVRNKYPDITWYMGGAEGCDTFAQDYLASKDAKIFVYDKGEQNNLRHDGQYKNGFATYIERDAYMVSQCSGIVVCCFDDVKSLGSGSFANVVSKSISSTIALQFFEFARNNTYDTVIEYCTQFHDGYHSTKLLDIVKKCLVIPRTSTIVTQEVTTDTLPTVETVI